MVRWLGGAAAASVAILCLACGQTSRDPNASGRDGEAGTSAAGGGKGGDSSSGGAAPGMEGPDCAAELASGDAHHCARYRDGSVWCWGEGSQGRLGDGMARAASQPVPTGLTDIVLLESGPEYTCAVDQASAIHCWGRNVEGQVGGTIAFEPSPRRSSVSTGGGVSRLGLGRTHGCVLDRLSHVTCWGTDEAGTRSEGQLLDGLNQPWADLLSGHRSPLLLTLQGVVVKVESWAMPLPTAYYGLDNEAIATSGNHSCALKRSGSLWCSDYRVDAITLRPQRAVGESAVQVGAGENFRCALTEQGRVYCDGSGGSGQLGNGEDAALGASAPVVDLEGAVEISVGAASACARRDDGTVWCWGAYVPGRAARRPELVSGCSEPSGLPGPPARSEPSPAARMAEASQERGQAVCGCNTDPLWFDACAKEEALVPSAGCLLALAPDDTQRWDCLANYLRAEAACWDANRVCPDNTIVLECIPDACPAALHEEVEMYCRRSQPCGYATDGPTGRWRICDGVVDCPNGADELNCTPNQTAFNCVDGTTIPISSVGSGGAGCPDGSDLPGF